MRKRKCCNTGSRGEEKARLLCGDDVDIASDMHVRAGAIDTAIDPKREQNKNLCGMSELRQKVGGVKDMEKVYNLKEAAEILGVSVRTLRYWIQTGVVHSGKYKTSKRRYIFESEIKRMQEQLLQ